MNVTDKTVLVLGTQKPWVEAVLLTMKPKKIVTLEYGYFIRLGHFIITIIILHSAITLASPLCAQESFVSNTLMAPWTDLMWFSPILQLSILDKV